MRVLNTEDISAYGYMHESLAYTAIGNYREAIAKANEQLLRHKEMSAEEITDISLYIAKLFMAIGEIDAGINMLFPIFDIAVNKGRVYALMAYGYYLAADKINADYYHGLLSDWNTNNADDAVDEDYLYIKADDEDRVNIIKEALSEGKESERLNNNVIYDAVREVTDNIREGNIKEAYHIINTLGTSIEERFIKAELYALVDKAYGRESRERYEIADSLMRDDVGENERIRLIAILEDLGRYSDMAHLYEEIVEKANICIFNFKLAICYYNIGEYDKARLRLNKLDRIYGRVFPYVHCYQEYVSRTSNTKLKVNTTLCSDITIRDYFAERLIRSIEEGNFREDILSGEIDKVVKAFLLDETRCDITDKLTDELCAFEEGRELLKECLIDINIYDGETIRYIIFRLLSYTDNISVNISGRLRRFKFRYPGELNDTDRNILNECYAISVFYEDNIVNKLFENMEAVSRMSNRSDEEKLIFTLDGALDREDIAEYTNKDLSEINDILSKNC